MEDEFPSAEDIAALPLTKEDLRALFDHLDRPGLEPCAHTFRETEAFLVDRGIPKEPVIRWLQEHGGYCDCEVIYNVDAEWGEWAGREPYELTEEELAECERAAKRPWWKFW
jgi:hypothetical protein